MRRALIAAAVYALVATAPAAAAGCDETSWTAGSVDLCEGELVYRDYVYDDYGADTGATPGERPGTLSTPAGDVRYPVEARNSADLVHLRLKLDGDRLDVEAQLNALYAPDQTVVALAIDTDDNQLTGGGAWPGIPISSKGWEQVHVFDRADVARNTITGSIGVPPGSRWRLQAVTARKGGPVMNVAFRGPNEQAAGDFKVNAYTPRDVGTWFEDLQSRAIRDGDISAFGHAVDVADLRGKVTRVAPPTGPGLHERVYVSDHAVPPGEGITYSNSNDRVRGRGTGGSATAFSQHFDLRGRYQPYGIYVPRKPGPHGVQFEYHGSNASLTSLINQPGMQQQFGEDLNRLLVVPEARGPDGYGSDISERDLLDVYDDVLENFDVDRDAIFASGYSQGGYIAFRMAALYPDRFAGLVSWVGFTGDDANGTPARGTVAVTAGAVGNMIDFVGNFRHIPAALIYAGADELVPLPSAEAMAAEYRKREYPFEFFVHPTAEHLTFGPLDDWRKEAAYTKALRRASDPARVTYRTDPSLGNPAFGIVHDRAYWVSEIRGRAAGFQDTDLTSHGCGGPVPTTEAGRSSGTAPVPWTSDFRRVTGSRRLVVANRLEGTLSNVASMRVDTRRACLGDQALDYRLVTDGPLTIRLSDGRSIVISRAGTHTGRLAAVPRAGGDTPAASRACASTAGFSSVGVAAAQRGAQLTFRRLAPGPVSIDVFRQSRGRRVLGERLVARFARVTDTVTWNGRDRRGRSLGDGYYFARYRLGRDVRRVALRRLRGRFRTRPAFYRRVNCDLLSSYKLTRGVFGGTGRRPLGISFRLARAGEARVEVLRRGRVVRTYDVGSVPKRRTIRLAFRSQGQPRGDYRVRLVATSGETRIVSTLTARKL